MGTTLDKKRVLDQVRHISGRGQERNEMLSDVRSYYGFAKDFGQAGYSRPVNRNKS